MPPRNARAEAQTPTVVNEVTVAEIPIEFTTDAAWFAVAAAKKLFDPILIREAEDVFKRHRNGSNEELVISITKRLR